MKRDGEAGFAVLAAMMAAAVFAVVGVQVVAASRAATVSGAAEASRTRAIAAAEAGFAMALAGLEAEDAQARWALDSSPKGLDYGDLHLTVRIEDEWGKIPLNGLTADRVRAMFTLAGAGTGADALAGAFLAARHDPGTPGAVAGRAPGFDGVSDLLQIAGMTPDLYAAIAPSATVAARDAAFEPRTATPLALEVMTGAAPGSPEVIARERVLAGEAPTLDAGPPLKLAGRPVTIRVTVDGARGDTLERAEIVEPTRAKGRPYVIRALQTDDEVTPRRP